MSDQQHFRKMQFAIVFLVSALAVVAANPYGVRDGYDRDNVQRHSPANEDFRSDRFDTDRTGGRKGGVISDGGYNQGRPLAGRGQGDYSEGRPTEGYPIQRRPYGGQNQGDYFESRPYGDHSHGDYFESRQYGRHNHGDYVQGRPTGQTGYGSAGLEQRPIHGGQTSRLDTEERSHSHGRIIGGVDNVQHRMGY